MTKVFSFTQSLMNGTVTMKTQIALFATRELAEQTLADVKAYNAGRDIGVLSIIYGEIRELDVYGSKDDIPFYQLKEGRAMTIKEMKGE